MAKPLHQLVMTVFFSKNLALKVFLSFSDIFEGIRIYISVSPPRTITFELSIIILLFLNKRSNLV